MDPVPPNLPLLTGSHKNNYLIFFEIFKTIVSRNSKIMIPIIVNGILHVSSKFATFFPEHANEVLYIAGAKFYLYLT